VIAATVVLALSFYPFLWPAQDEPNRADAVFVLSGDHGERQRTALDLLGSGVAPVLVFVGTLDSPSTEDLCGGRRLPYETVCLRPELPDNTRNEARAGATLAEGRGWKHIVVVTSTQHVARARLLFRRCFDGRVSVIGARAPYGFKTFLGQVAHEWAGMAHALVAARGC
jgi:hypothetical protein